MKFKLWQMGYEFDKADAELVFPLILLIFGLTLTPLNKTWLWAGVVAYYLLYFFLKPFVQGLVGFFGKVHHWTTFRCPYCKSREVILQGYQGYHSDSQHSYYLCKQCGETSVLVNERLIKANPNPPTFIPF